MKYIIDFVCLGDLARAYHSCTDSEERVSLLSGLTYHGGTKKIRKGLCELMANLYYDDNIDLK